MIQGDEIQAVGPQRDVAPPEGPNVRTIRVEPGKTVVPGMVDVHTHVIMPGDGTPYQTFLQHNDGILLMQAAQNARVHLMSGITTLADTGARGSVSFTLRDGINLGLVDGPRLILCGRPITRTGGHCWFLGAEADGQDAISRTARQLLKEGADIIKVMATGGGTVGSNPFRPSLRVEELAAAVNEAHAASKKAIAHVSSTVGITRVLDAKFDVLFHSHFNNADGSLCFQDDVARRIVDSGAYVNPTLYVNGVYVDMLRKKSEREQLNEQEQTQLAARTKRYAGQRENVGKLASYGVKMVVGSDAGWGRYAFGDLVTEMEEMVGIGMSAAETVVAATSRAADALGVGHLVGSLAEGRKADILILDGDPTQNISSFRNVEMVMLGGQVMNQDGGAHQLAERSVSVPQSA